MVSHLRVGQDNECVPDSPLVFDVLVDEGGYRDGDERVVPTWDEHERQTEDDSKQRQHPTTENVERIIIIYLINSFKPIDIIA